MAQLSIQDGIIQLVKEELANTSGSFTHSGDYTINGTITADTLNVKKIVTESGSPEEVGQWTVVKEEELNGKGFGWTWGEGSVRLNYRSGGRLWTNGNIDIGAGKSFKIDNVDVLSTGALGSSIVRSNLRKIGTLEKLEVDGHANIGGWAIFAESGRLGLGTENPNGALSVLDQDIEFIISGTSTGVANFGSYTNHDVSLITDNIQRLTVKKNGEVHIGDENYKNGVLKVHGTIEAESIVTDNRIERNSPLEFKETKTSSIYNLGLIWKGANTLKQLILVPGPDRFYSSESFDLKKDRAFYINGNVVLSDSYLGASITESSLTKVGALTELQVLGDATFHTNVSLKDVVAKNITFNDGVHSLTLTNTGVAVNKSLSISVQGSEELYLDKDEVIIGNPQNTRRPVKVFGPLSVGINNPDPSLSLAVSGNFSFNGRKFVTGAVAPTDGSYTKGDICWNSEPRPDSYIGWVCVVDGDPGEWLPFGGIGRQ